MWEKFKRFVLKQLVIIFIDNRRNKSPFKPMSLKQLREVHPDADYDELEALYNAELDRVRIMDAVSYDNKV